MNDIGGFVIRLDPTEGMPSACNCYANVLSMQAKEIDRNRIDWNHEEVRDVPGGRMKLGELGEFIREQRRSARLSLRKLSDLAGISNPYLSQIERGLRKPSAEILQAIA